MGVTYANGSITGRSAKREYSFLVVEEGDHVGLTHDEFDEVRQRRHRYAGNSSDLGGSTNYLASCEGAFKHGTSSEI